MSLIHGFSTRQFMRLLGSESWPLLCVQQGSDQPVLAQLIPPWNFCEAEKFQEIGSHFFFLCFTGEYCTYHHKPIFHSEMPLPKYPLDINSNGHFLVHYILIFYGTFETFCQWSDRWKGVALFSTFILSLL